MGMADGSRSAQLTSPPACCPVCWPKPRPCEGSAPVVSLLGARHARHDTQTPSPHPPESWALSLRSDHEHAPVHLAATVPPPAPESASRPDCGPRREMIESPTCTGDRSDSSPCSGAGVAFGGSADVVGIVDLFVDVIGWCPRARLRQRLGQRSRWGQRVRTANEFRMLARSSVSPFRA